MKKILLLIMMIGIWKLFHYEGQVILGPGVMVKEVPQQTKLASPVSHSLDDLTVNEVAKFNIKAKVLSKEYYSAGREGALSPVDLALGWGNMSDESILEQIKITQSNRFYFWHVQSFPIPRQEIENNSANMHIIPANDLVKSALNDIRQGDIIAMSGSLVNVFAKGDGWYWKSSQTRTDTGKGACELFWVENIRNITPYR